MKAIGLNPASQMSRISDEMADQEMISTPQPKVGFNQYVLDLNEHNTITKEELLLHSIEEGDYKTIFFKVDNDGHPIEFKEIGYGEIDQKIVEQIKSAGPWINTEKNEWISFEYQIVSILR